VVVGNITLGGTGKTPLVIWLVQQLAARGLRPGVVSRGYAGERHAGTHLVGADDAAGQVGDEPLLIGRRTGAPVVIGRHRVAGVAHLAELGVDIVISDDGLQHYALDRQMEIAVVDGERGLGNGRLLPAGPLREPAERLGTVDCVVRNGGAPEPGQLGMTLAGATMRNLVNDSRRPLADAGGETWHAVAGVGNPERFFRLLETQGIRLLRHPLPDHAALSAADLQFSDEYPILMTEKDAVKCQPFATERLWCLPVDVMFEPDAGERLIDLLTRRCGLSVA